MKTFRLLAVSWLALLAGPAFADLNISVTQGRVATQPIAVVPFAAPAGIPTDVAQVIDDDLSNSGLFRTINRNLMLEKPSDPAQVDYRNWRTVGMDDVVIGQMRQEGNGYAARFYLLDVYRTQQLIAYDIPAVPAGELRHLAHHIADLIYQQLTGMSGYFNTQIAYINVTGAGNYRRWQLIVADSDGEKPIVVASSSEPLMSPSWSPDRSQLTYVGFERSRSAIYLHTLATGQLRKYIFERGINGAPVWSPDGRRLAITLSFEKNPDIYVVDLATGTRRRITDSSAIDTEASWSPDGQWLTFTSDRGGSPQIYRVSANGGEAQRLTFQGKQNMRPVYSPDGKKIALVDNDGSALRIALFDLQTSTMKFLTDGPVDESPAFAPNGSLLMYTRNGDSGGTELATVSVDGQIKRSVRSLGSEVREPAWSSYIQ